MERRFFRPSEFAKLVGLSECTIRRMCRKAGLTKMAMSSAMNGKRNLTAEEYVAICNALEVDLDFFTKQEEEVVQ